MTKTDDWISIKIKENGTIITSDGRATDDSGKTFRTATEEEMMEYRTMQTEEGKHREEALKKELPIGIKISIRALIKNLNRNVADYEKRITYLESIKETHPYRDYGLNSFKEAVGYLMDTISDLKKLIGE